jgi:formylglycine-generating enzyme required for sulfatase activity
VPAEPEVVVIAAGDALLDDPMRTVHVNVFAIARHPVTNSEFAEFVAATADVRTLWRDGPENHPAEGVSWADAVAYCRWLSVTFAKIYRLPDEREWEKAARGVRGRRWPWGDDDDAGRANVSERKVGGTSPVGRFIAGASPEGLVDLIGNVREWTNTWVDGGRVLRGGSYHDELASCVPSKRLRAPDDRLRAAGATGDAGGADGLLGFGFRVVRGMTGR